MCEPNRWTLFTVFVLDFGEKRQQFLGSLNSSRIRTLNRFPKPIIKYENEVNV